MLWFIQLPPQKARVDTGGSTQLRIDCLLSRSHVCIAIIILVELHNSCHIAIHSLSKANMDIPHFGCKGINEMITV